MSRRSISARAYGIVVSAFAASTLPAHAGVIQLMSPQPLGHAVTTILHTSTEDLLPSPFVVVTPENAVTFVLETGDWRRLHEGVNVVSDFAPGTQLLYTNNNNGNGLDGQGTVGGGGSGPAEIHFAEGVRAVGFRAQMGVLGLETLTFSLFNDLELLGTFSVSRTNGQQQNDSASFLGARATGTDVITRIVLTGDVVQLGELHLNDFFFGPVSYRVPEPSTIALLSVAAAVAAGRWRRARRRATAARVRL